MAEQPEIAEESKSREVIIGPHKLIVDPKATEQLHKNLPVPEEACVVRLKPKDGSTPVQELQSLVDYMQTRWNMGIDNKQTTTHHILGEPRQATRTGLQILSEGNTDWRTEKGTPFQQLSEIVGVDTSGEFIELLLLKPPVYEYGVPNAPELVGQPQDDFIARISTKDPGLAEGIRERVNSGKSVVVEGKGDAPHSTDVGMGIFTSISKKGDTLTEIPTVVSKEQSTSGNVVGQWIDKDDHLDDFTFVYHPYQFSKPNN